MNYEFHPLAGIFPLIDGKPYAELMADVMKHGVREPVWLYEGKILDGRNRYRAAKTMGVEIQFRDYVGADPVAFVISLNLHRRHLNEAQRAAVAAKLANLRVGGDHSANLPNGVSQAKAAEMLNVSTRSVTAAARVIHQGAAELVTALESGDVSISAAAAVACMTPEEQKTVALGGATAIKAAAKTVRDEPQKRQAMGKPAKGPKADAIRAELDEARERGVSMLSTYARLLLKAIEAQSDFTEEERGLLEQINCAIASQLQ